MAVSSSVTLPANPTAGETLYIPLGGDGRSAPLGCYFCRVDLAGDASGGGALITINFDQRYTNLVAYANLRIQADAAAGDFSMQVVATSAAATADRVQIVGTIPQVATAVTGDNGGFLWYPAPIFFQGRGSCLAQVPNVGALETYKLTVEVLCFDIDIRRLTPLPLLMLNVPGVSAPAAI